ncbi:MAG TPA: fused MFS/spermidine synthase [Steroidobacteraceae bacterium]|jgi:predicted membrane-bound spermidine synthase
MATTAFSEVNPAPRLRALALPFFLSGVAALAYQICWQRLLFVALGADIDSVTIIVSTFMLGLGTGSLIGGELADRYPQRILLLFAAAEAGIGLFGLFSPNLITTVGNLVVRQSLPIISATNFVLLLIPTTLMGATLPMLVALLVRRQLTIGVSIGGLYCLNTLGAALGAILVGFICFYFFELNTVIYGAALINFFVSSLTLWIAREQR